MTDGTARKTTEPAFGSDSFLDVICNLVGIVLIIIVMVAARVRELPHPSVAASDVTATEEPEQPDWRAMDEELRKQEEVVASLQRELLAALEALRQAELMTLPGDPAQPDIARRRAAAEAILAQTEKTTKAALAVATTAEKEQTSLRERIAALQKAMSEVKAKPMERRSLRYQLPVSRVVGEEELLFECRNGKVTCMDLQPMLEEVKNIMRQKGEELKSRWEVTDTVGPVGAFRMEYVIARERSTPVDTAFGQLPPADDGHFSYGLARWELIPIWNERGETVSDALARGSRFRAAIDNLNPAQVALTFFVYPDSFTAYRSLRDHLHERGFVVAGRPLEMNRPIAGSRRGSLSRGQ